MSQHQGLESHVAKPESDYPPSADYAPYPKLDPNDVAPPKEDWTTVTISSQTPHPVSQNSGSPISESASEGPAPIARNSATTMPVESNPYISSSPAPASSMKSEYLIVACVGWSSWFFCWTFYFLGFWCNQCGIGTCEPQRKEVLNISVFYFSR